MFPPIPNPEDYDVSSTNGFLPTQPPLTILPHPYYDRWEQVLANLQPLLLSRRLRQVVQHMPVLSTQHLQGLEQWRRAYLILAFLTHGYIWGGDRPEERIPPPLAVPFLQVCEHLELPPVATYAGVCLWNFRPIFADEPLDSLENLATLSTFTGSLDESWFYLVSVAIEARGAPLIPILLNAVAAARRDDVETVTGALQTFAERMDEIGSLLTRMYENCDPHVFYHRIRPFLAGSKNMAEAGLPRGILYEDGSGTEQWRQYGGGSNAQSSLIQFFDIILGILHHPTGEGPPEPVRSSCSSGRNVEAPTALDAPSSPTSPPGPPNNFLHEMRTYMPGPHARFLADSAPIANIRPYVLSKPTSDPVVLAYDAALAMLRSMRDKHIQIVSRYIIVPSRKSRNAQPRSTSPRAAPTSSFEYPPAPVSSPPAAPASVLNTPGLSPSLSSPPLSMPLSTPATPSTPAGALKSRTGPLSLREEPHAKVDIQRTGSKRGTGGTALLPFLKQARDETGSGAVDAWARRLLGDRPVVNAFGGGSRASCSGSSGGGVGGSNGWGYGNYDKNRLADQRGSMQTGGVEIGKVGEHADGVIEIVGLAGTWGIDESEGGLCHW